MKMQNILILHHELHKQQMDKVLRPLLTNKMSNDQMVPIKHEMIRLFANKIMFLMHDVIIFADIYLTNYRILFCEKRQSNASQSLKQISFDSIVGIQCLETSFDALSDIVCLALLISICDGRE